MSCFTNLQNPKTMNQHSLIQCLHTSAKQYHTNTCVSQHIQISVDVNGHISGPNTPILNGEGNVDIFSLLSQPLALVYFDSLASLAFLFPVHIQMDQPTTVKDRFPLFSSNTVAARLSKLGAMTFTQPERNCNSIGKTW